MLTKLQTVAEAFAYALRDAERPAILVGGGAYKPRATIREFSERHSIPVFRTWNALDAITDDCQTYAGTVGTYGGPGRNFGVQNADLLLVLGCRVSGRITGGKPETFARAARRYWVDVDADLLEAHEWQAHVRVVCRAGLFLQSVPKVERVGGAWEATCCFWRDRYDPVRPEMLSEWHHYGFMRRLSEALPANAIVTYDTGGNAIMMGHCFRSKWGQRIFSSNGNSPMGFAMCGAIGAWFAEPTRPIVCIIGDGGFQLNAQELQTIRHYNIPVKIFVIQNRVLGNTLFYQIQNKKARVACSPEGGYSSPNFVALAHAYGIKGMSLGEWERFDYVVQGALAHDGPCLVEVVDEGRCSYFPCMTMWDAGIEEMHPPVPEFADNMLVPPLEGWEERAKRYQAG